MQNAQAVMNGIVDNIGKVIFGKRRAVELTVIALVCRGHILVEDVPGVGKTSLVAALARSVDSSFRRIQFTPDIMPSDITGFSMYNPKTGEFDYREGLVLRSFVLADEINRASPKTQASLLEAMEENTVTVDGTAHHVPQPFMVMATQNPTEYVGTYPLPEAQMDRFMMRISIGYPSKEEEIGILQRFRLDEPLAGLSPAASGEQVLQIQEAVRGVYVDNSLYDYIVSITQATRAHPDVELGASPRGSLSLFRAAQAWALYMGREYAVPDDIRLMAPHVLSHRLILRQDARLRGASAAAAVQSVLASLPVPRGRVNEG